MAALGRNLPVIPSSGLGTFPFCFFVTPACFSSLFCLATQLFSSTHFLFNLQPNLLPHVYPRTFGCSHQAPFPRTLPPILLLYFSHLHLHSLTPSNLLPFMPHPTDRAFPTYGVSIPFYLLVLPRG